ncbi:MAG: hypothetical protein ABIQ57_06245, partial [Candidatus Kapaibacterium sp.]
MNSIYRKISSRRVSPIHPPILSLVVMFFLSLTAARGNRFDQPWRNLPTGSGAALTSIAADSANSIMVGTTGDGVFRSVDGGPWRSANIGLKDSRIVRLAASPAGYLLVATESGIFRSIDHGASWQFSIGNPAGKIFSIAFDSVGTAYAGGVGGVLLRSDDHGITWSAIDLTKTVPNIGGIFSLSVDSRNTIVASMYENGVPSISVLYSSTDRGVTWNNINNAQTKCFSVAVATDSHHHWFQILDSCNGFTGIYRNIDGATWEPIGHIHPTAIFIDSHDHIILAASGGMLISQDGSATFEGAASDTIMRPIAIVQLADRTLAAADAGKIYRSTDGGASWHTFSNASASILADAGRPLHV